MSINEENTFRVQFPAKKELAVLLGKPRSKEMEPTWVSCAVLWSSSWSVTMSTHYLPHFSMLAVKVPARFDVSWVPQEPHMHKEKGTMMLSAVWTYSLGILTWVCSMDGHPFLVTAFGGLKCYRLQGLVMLEVTEICQKYVLYPHTKDTNPGKTNRQLTLKYLSIIILFVAEALSDSGRCT